jgi:predicted DNA-binding transcriptional regulator AlpA
MTTHQSLSDSALLALPQIVGDRKRGIPALVPISRSSWWSGVKEGKYPKPVRISSRRVAWRSSDIAALLERIASGQGAA